MEVSKCQKLKKLTQPRVQNINRTRDIALNDLFKMTVNPVLVVTLKMDQRAVLLNS